MREAYGTQKLSVLFLVHDGFKYRSDKAENHRN